MAASIPEASGVEGAAAPPGAGASRLGQTLGGRWKLENVLGTGGSASVYSARHRNGRQAAVKVLHGDLSRHPRVVRRFLAEGYAANKVGHPGVVAILDDGQEPDGTMFLVMELLRGESLAQRFERQGRLAAPEVTTVAVGILDVLAAAHDAGIVHRDIKPSNVFWTEAQEIKVLDFGAARVREAEDFVTRSGTTLGTPAFMAPELAAGRVEEVDARTDVWAVGATMFQLLTGSTTHGARSANEAIVTAATRPVPPIASVRPDLAPALSAIVDRALAFEKKDRWPNARTMQAELLAIHPEAAAQRRVVEDSATSLPESRRTPHRRRTVAPWLLVTLALIGLAGVIATSMLTGAKKTEAPREARALATGAPGSAEVAVPLTSAVSTKPELAPLKTAEATDQPEVRRPSLQPTKRLQKPKPVPDDFAVDTMFDKRR